MTLRTRGESPRRSFWIATAVAVLALGTLAAFLGAQNLSHADVQQAHANLQTSSAEIASTLNLAIQHEQDLAISAGRLHRREPQRVGVELPSLGQQRRRVPALSRDPRRGRSRDRSPVPAPGLRRASRDQRARVQRTEPDLHADAPGQAAVLLPRGRRARARRDCPRSRSDSTCATRRSDHNCSKRATPVSRRTRPTHLGGPAAFAVGTPLYRNGSHPNTLAARRADLIGFTGTEILPKTILTTALLGHPNDAVAFHYRAQRLERHVQGRSSAEERDLGFDQPPQRMARAGLHARPSPAASSAAVDSTLLFLGGALLSLLLGLLIYVLGTSRSSAMQLVKERTDQLQHQALHDSLTGLPNRALILDRIDRMLARSRRDTRAGRGALPRPRQLQGHQRHPGSPRRRRTVGQRRRSTEERGARERHRRTTRRRRVRRPRRRRLAGGRRGRGRRAPPRRHGDAIHHLGEQGAARGVGEHRHRRRRSHHARGAAPGRRHRALSGEGGRQTAGRAGSSRRCRSRSTITVAWRSTCKARSKREQFFLMYQPTVDLSTGAFTGVEALLRWRHPERGVVQPDDFIPALESSGLIVPVGAWVLHEACRQGALWQSRGHRFTVSVNISAKQLERDQLVTDVREAIIDERLRRRRTHPGTHRDGADARLRCDAVAADAVEGPRRAGRHRRLRHRLLVARLPATVPDRHLEDRSILRVGHRRLQGVRGARAHARATRQGAGHRDDRRGRRDQRPALAARDRDTSTRDRASCSRVRSPSRTSIDCSSIRPASPNG